MVFLRNKGTIPSRHLMKSLVCSDIHDHVKNLESALMVANTANCDSVICCGDICSSFILDVYNTLCNLPFHVIFGNNDGDKFHLTQKASFLNSKRSEENQIHLHGEFLLADKGHTLSGIPAEISLAVYHYPQMARVLADSGKYNVVCFGHSHESSIEKVGDTILINPGSLMGYIAGKEMNHVKPSCVIINWQSGELELIDL